jgi:hypothetical protein
MKMLGFLAVAVASLFLFVTESFAKDVHVKGYTRKDGTYVRPHVRSSPDTYKWNNYGPSRNDSELMNPRARDNDHDGVPNYLDRNDDNDSRPDDSDHRQYTPDFNKGYP